MNSCILALILVASAFAVSAVPVAPPVPDTDDIQVTVINDWTLPDKALGLDIFVTPGDDYVAGIDNGDDQLDLWENGAITDFITLPPASSGHSWGVACRDEGDTVVEILVNDFDSYSMYRSLDVGETWTTVDDPGGKYSRGMDYDGTHYWTVINGYTDELCRFLPGGASQTWQIPEIGASQQGSGLTSFPLENGDTGIALGVFDSPQFFFWGWDGSTLYYIGSVATPFASEMLVSFGLTYCEGNDHFYWTYGPTSGFRMVEFTVDFDAQALSSATWGCIKSSF